MSGVTPARFAAITAQLEDLHSIAVEGQQRDNSPDMQRAFASYLRKGVAALGTSIKDINRELRDATNEVSE